MSYSTVFDSLCYMGVNNQTRGYDDITAERSEDFLSRAIFGGWRMGDEGVIGFGVDDMKEDETKKEFRRRVFEALKLVGYTGEEAAVDWQLPSYVFEEAE